eukprot:14977919-Heterocapsa_arctica.AAC.1
MDPADPAADPAAPCEADLCLRTPDDVSGHADAGQGASSPENSNGHAHAGPGGDPPPGGPAPAPGASQELSGGPAERFFRLLEKYAFESVFG